MAKPTRYPTRPIDSWARMQELNRSRSRSNLQAREQGAPVIFGLGNWFLAMMAGFGDYVDAGYGPYYDISQCSRDEVVPLLEALEARGYPRDVCSTMRFYLAQVVKEAASPCAKPKAANPVLAFQVLLCRSLAKTATIASKMLDIPCFVVDHPNVDNKSSRDYLVSHLLEAIEWLEIKTRIKFDDEKFLEALPIEWDSAATWARILELNKGVPATLSVKQLRALRGPVTVMRHRRECLGYLKELHDEVKDRLARGISANGLEEKRLVHEGQAPGLWVDAMLELPERYGAVFVMADVILGLYGAWQQLDDGSLRAAPGFHEKGFQIKTREDALRAEVDLYLSHIDCSTPILFESADRPRQSAKRAVDWHADGVIFHINRGCHQDSAGILQRKTEVQKTGIPTMAYEGSYDIRDLTKELIVDRFDSFLESLGLRPLAE